MRGLDYYFGGELVIYGLDLGVFILHETRGIPVIYTHLCILICMHVS